MQTQGLPLELPCPRPVPAKPGYQCWHSASHVLQQGMSGRVCCGTSWVQFCLTFALQIIERVQTVAFQSASTQTAFESKAELLLEKYRASMLCCGADFGLVLG